MPKLQFRLLPHRIAQTWGWLCPVLAIAVAAAVLAAIGLSFWTALIVALLLVCPALLVWGAIELRDPGKRKEEQPDRTGPAQ